MNPLQNKKLARYLGPSHDVGQAMCSKLLTTKGRIICSTYALPLTAAERNNPIVRDQIDETLKAALGDQATGIPSELDDSEIDD
jgi:hypothetical protein